MKVLLLLALGVTFTLAHHHLQDFQQANVQFTADVYKQVKQDVTGNFLISPLSLQVVLSLAEIGARDQTASELTSALHIPEKKEDVEEIFRELAPYLQANKDYTLATANKIYIQKGCTIKEHFRNVTLNSFKADIENIEFEKNTEAANTINDWVKQKTHNKIQNLFKADDFTIDSRAVLLNAMYFKGKWEKRFSKEQTEKKPFYLTRKSYVNVNMMDKIDSVNYYYSSTLNTKFVELPYKGDDITLVVALPKGKEGLADLEKSVQDVLVPPRFKTERVHLKLPKFKIETTTKFNSILQKLGIEKAFARNADFQDIFVENEPLFLSKVIQKAFIETDEEGTTAAVATGASMSTYRSMKYEPDPIEFNVNHPFIFYLKHKQAGILFVGRYSEPIGEVVKLNEPVADESAENVLSESDRLKIRL